MNLIGYVSLRCFYRKKGRRSERMPSCFFADASAPLKTDSYIVTRSTHTLSTGYNIAALLFN